MDNQDKLISIGLPVYNGEKFIRQALDSLLAQTYQNLEINISDNASIDQTEAVCREYAAKDKRVHYYRNERNLGGWNFRRVLELATGEYFMWAAHDDLWHKDFIAKLVAGLEDNKDCDMAASNVININIAGKVLSRNSSIKKFADKNHLNALVDFLREPEIFGKANLVYGIYRAEFIKKIYDRYEMSNEYWGTDSILLFGCLCRTNLYVCEDYLFFKRDTKTVVNFSRPDDANSDDHTFPPLKYVDDYVNGFILAAKGTIYEELAKVIMNLRRDLYLKNRPGGLKRLVIIFSHLFMHWGWKNLIFKLKIIFSQAGLKGKLRKIKELFNNY